MTVRRLMLSTAAAAALVFGAAQANAQTAADARATLSAGYDNAGQIASGMELEHHLAPPPGFYDADALIALPQTEAEGRAFAERMRTNPPRYGILALANSDMAMADGKLFVGNFNGFNAYDVTGGGEPKLVMSVVCPGGQGDLSIHGNLLFMSVEQNRARLDCGTTAAEGDVNPERFRGIRIFDISDLNAPRQIAAVQTCRGSHTHTLVPSDDPNVLYIYNSATSGVRKSDELGICSDGQPDANPETALYSIDVIKVPLDHPEQAAIVNRPRIFADRETGRVAGLWRGGAAGVASQRTATTNHCHDITVFPELKLAAGACSGNGILLDISDPQNPSRVSELFDPDMAYWHSATFNNTGDQVVFTDEWGGGTAARCQSSDPNTWGANLIASIDDRTLKGETFFKPLTSQGKSENCVAHNGTIIPVPGRDLMVQAWYQGGVSIMDFTDPSKPVEIAYFDRGPIDADKLIVGGSWSAYWLNGRIYSSEIARGLDVFKLVPSEQLSAAEIAAAEAVAYETINPQTQVKATWADSADVAQSYLDQLGRTGGLDAALAERATAGVARWREGGAAGGDDTQLAADLTAAATAAAPAAAGANETAAQAAERAGKARTAARLTALAGLFERRSA